MKTCTKCNVAKPIDEFHKRSSSKDGRCSRCKVCRRKDTKAWFESNRERHCENAKRWHRNNRERSLNNKKAWRERNLDKVKQDNKVWRQKNQDRLKEARALWYRENKDRHREAGRAWARRNRHLTRGYSAKWRERNPGYDLARYHQTKHLAHVRHRIAIRSVLHNFLRRAKQEKRGATHAVLGYSSDLLRQRMEYQFEPGMSWENHGEWHIDHKIPVSHFLAKGETRPHIINALSNLQPLWATENQRKSATHPLEWKAETQEKGQVTA